MRWVWLGLSVACFVVVFRTHSMGLAALCLLGALGFILMATLAFAARRIEARGRSEATMLSGEELRAVREQIERRKREGSGDDAPAAAGTGAMAGGHARTRDDADVDSISSGDGSSD
jgi:hypothetical protein